MFETDIHIIGKHASYMKFLSAKTEKNDSTSKGNAAIFERNIDVYMISALIGAIYKLKSPVDKEINDKTNILLGAITPEIKNLEFIFRLVLLVDDSRNLSNDEKINSVFRNPGKDEEELFNSYVRGGLDYLYEYFNDGTNDYYQKMVELLDRINPIDQSISNKLNDLINA